jgi:hypothetical protein
MNRLTIKKLPAWCPAMLGALIETHSLFHTGEKLFEFCSARIIFDRLLTPKIILQPLLNGMEFWWLLVVFSIFQTLVLPHILCSETVWVFARPLSVCSILNLTLILPQMIPSDSCWSEALCLVAVFQEQSRIGFFKHSSRLGNLPGDMKKMCLAAGVSGLSFLLLTF